MGTHPVGLIPLLRVGSGVRRGQPPRHRIGGNGSRPPRRPRCVPDDRSSFFPSLVPVTARMMHLVWSGQVV